MRKNILRVVLLLAGLVIAGSGSVHAQANGKLGPFLTTLVEEFGQRGEEAARSTAEIRGMKLRSGPGGALVPVILVPLPGAVASSINTVRIEALGGQVDAVSTSFMRVLVPFNLLNGLANLPDVTVVRAPTPALELSPGFGASVSESVYLTGAADFQLGGIIGAGTSVAVVDLGFEFASLAILLGELPANTLGLDLTGLGLQTGTPHGTGVAEHVSDMAPGALLYLIKIGDEVDMEIAADFIRDEDGPIDDPRKIRIANHSVGWVNGSYYDDDDTSPITSIINRSHDTDGVFWTVAAGNQAERHWRGDWLDTDGNGWLNFAGDDEKMELSSASSVVYIFLNWNQYGDSQTDLDLYVVDKRNRTTASSKGIQGGSQDPGEFVAFNYVSRWAPYSVKVRYEAGPTDLLAGLNLTLFSFYNDFEYAVAASSLMEPADAHGAFTVGAINQADWGLASPPPEPFSSQGPTTDGRVKPDIAAPDGTTSLVYGIQGSFGTSFSSPTMAGAAALLLEYSPGSTADQLASMLSGLAIDIGVPGPDSVFGAGKLDLGTGPEVPANDAPVVSITSPANDSSLDSGTAIFFEGSAMDTEDEDLTGSLVWTSSLDPLPLGGGGRFSISFLAAGTHTITASVTDSGSKMGSASITVTVLAAPGQPTDLIVDSITYATAGGRNHNRNLSITLAVVDGLGNPVADASVTIWLISETFFGSGTAPTGADGTVEFSLRDAPPGTYITLVMDVVADGYVWNSVTPENSFTK